MGSQKGRQAWVNLSYTRYKDGKPVKRACDVMKEFMESFTYSDCAIIQIPGSIRDGCHIKKTACRHLL